MSVRFACAVYAISRQLNNRFCGGEQAKRPATTVWSPLSDQRGLLAAGTVANAIDDSFETTADLEIFAVDFSAGSPKEMPVKGSIKCNERFHRLAWGGLSGTGGLSYGILAGGMVDGSIGLWNPAKLIKAEEGDPVVARVQKHKGPVRGLDFNPFKPNLLASGATESEILIWNLQNPEKPDVYTPGAPTQPLMDINCVAWNPKVEHILASTGASGTSVVWDLRQKRPVISFTDTVNKTSRAALAWNPEVATQVLASLPPLPPLRPRFARFAAALRSLLLARWLASLLSLWCARAGHGGLGRRQHAHPPNVGPP